MNKLFVTLIFFMSFTAIEAQAGELSETEINRLDACRERLETWTGANALISTRRCLEKIKKEKEVITGNESHAQRY